MFFNHRPLEDDGVGCCWGIVSSEKIAEFETEAWIESSLATTFYLDQMEVLSLAAVVVHLRYVSLYYSYCSSVVLQVVEKAVVAAAVVAVAVAVGADVDVTPHVV